MIRRPPQTGPLGARTAPREGGAARNWLPPCPAPGGACRPAPWAADARDEPPVARGADPVEWLAVLPACGATPAPTADEAESTAAAAAEPDAADQARAEGERVLALARAEAASLLQAARAEAAAERSLARRAGWEEGRRQARAEWGHLIGAAAGTLRRARHARSALLHSLRAEVADLAMAVAARVLGRELEAVPDEVVDLARRLVRRVDGPTVLRVRPEDAPLLEAEPLPPGVRLVPDATLAQGDLRLESADGVLDATVQGRFAQVLGAMRGGDGDGA